ncbi:hypothetical protein Pcinc_036786 [Petrolisthes cinctipes]|uniref:Uncharacterized protein n=1 Tax=Petrolisthes cinctipes TaxID=88211 RepID=A0AAE1EM87_PETCI|nr:hypothetical protein Pcinc_036786 [Petrolisthes cinctipes]
MIRLVGNEERSEVFISSLCTRTHQSPLRIDVSIKLAGVLRGKTLSSPLWLPALVRGLMSNTFTTCSGEA